jgi:putative copper export protein
MTNKRHPAALKPRTWKDEVRAQNEIVGRLCVELGIDQAELFLRARERLRFCCQQIRKRRNA